jgi:hypothetical protein
MKRRQEIQKAHSGMPMPEITNQLRREFAGLSNGLLMNPLLRVQGKLTCLFHTFHARQFLYLIGIDIHIDTPTEILHTLLLGMAKYLWVEVVKTMDKEKNFDLFCTRLQSLSVAGINTDRPIPNYICTNRGSLNGKHFKILTQTIGFCLYDLVPNALRTAWASLSRLTVLAWYSVIHDMRAYIVSFRHMIHGMIAKPGYFRWSWTTRSRFYYMTWLNAHHSC